MDSPLVLVTDDDDNIRLILEAELIDLGCRVVTAVNGREGVDKAIELGPDLILLDVMMPVMTGYEACEIIRKDKRTSFIPILFVTGMDQSASILKGFQVGANDYISKPFNREELRARVSTHLQLRHMLRDLADLEKRRSLTTLIAGLMHEILNPLQIIMGHLSLLESMPHLGEHKGSIEAMLRGTERIQKVITALKEYSGEKESRPVTTDVNRLVARAMELTHAQFAQRGVTLDVILDPAVPAVNTTPNRLTQVVVQLLSNAATHTPTGRQVRLGTSHDRDNVHIKVTDQGPGINPQDLAQVFDPFFTHKTVWSSLGLGLSVAQRIVEDQGGQLSVESTLGEGSTFTIALPLPVVR